MQHENCNWNLLTLILQNRLKLAIKSSLLNHSFGRFFWQLFSSALDCFSDDSIKVPSLILVKDMSPILVSNWFLTDNNLLLSTMFFPLQTYCSCRLYVSLIWSVINICIIIVVRAEVMRKIFWPWLCLRRTNTDFCVSCVCELNSLKDYRNSSNKTKNVWVR